MGGFDGTPIENRNGGCGVCTDHIHTLCPHTCVIRQALGPITNLWEKSDGHKIFINSLIVWLYS